MNFGVRVEPSKDQTGLYVIYINDGTGERLLPPVLPLDAALSFAKMRFDAIVTRQIEQSTN